MATRTEKLVAALQAVLGDDYKVFVCMRYWHPMAASVAGQVASWNPDDIVMLPLYPQYSTTTTASSSWMSCCFCRSKTLLHELQRKWW